MVLRLLSGGEFVPETISEQLCLLEKLNGRQPSFLQIPGDCFTDDTWISYVDPPVKGCFQSVHAQLESPKMTQVLAMRLLGGDEEYNSLPSPWEWTAASSAVDYRSGLHIIDISFRVEEGTTIEAIRSNHIWSNITQRGISTRLGASDALIAIALQEHQFFKLLKDSQASRIVIAGIELHSHPSSSVSLALLFDWLFNGQRQQPDATLANLPLRRCLVPVVTRVQSLQEIKQRQETASESR